MERIVLLLDKPPSKHVLHQQCRRRLGEARPLSTPTSKWHLVGHASLIERLLRWDAQRLAEIEALATLAVLNLA
jgi:hypothetical protein